MRGVSSDVDADADHAGRRPYESESTDLPVWRASHIETRRGPPAAAADALYGGEGRPPPPPGAYFRAKRPPPGGGFSRHKGRRRPRSAHGGAEAQGLRRAGVGRG